MPEPTPPYGPEPVDTSDFTPEEKAELAAIEAGRENTGSTPPGQPTQKPPKEPHEHSTPVLIACMVAALAIGGITGTAIYKGIDKSGAPNINACESAFDDAETVFTNAGTAVTAIGAFLDVISENPYSASSAVDVLAAKLDPLTTEIKDIAPEYHRYKADCLGK